MPPRARPNPWEPCRRPGRPRTILALALACAGEAVAISPWGGPDLSYAPDPRTAPGWTDQAMARVWTRVVAFEAGEDGPAMVVPAEPEEGPRLQVGRRLGIYYRTGDGRQGLAGHGTVATVDREAGMARVPVRLAHAMTFHEHDPWKGWQARVSFRPGYEPDRIAYFASPENLTALEPEDWEAVLAGRVYRGMAAREVLRSWGAPAARGAHDFAHGRQEQWVYQVDALRRAYVYLDVATARVTGWHQGGLARYAPGGIAAR